jgi:hypothetical protein
MMGVPKSRNPKIKKIKIYNPNIFTNQNKVGDVQQQLCLYYYFQAVPSPDTMAYDKGC